MCYYWRENGRSHNILVWRIRSDEGCGVCVVQLGTIIYPVSVDPYSIQVRHPRVCKDEAHWLVVKLVIPGPMSFVFTYSVRSYLDTLGVHANWIDYRDSLTLCDLASG